MCGSESYGKDFKAKKYKLKNHFLSKVTKIHYSEKPAGELRSDCSELKQRALSKWVLMRIAAKNSVRVVNISRTTLTEL